MEGLGAFKKKSCYKVKYIVWGATAAHRIGNIFAQEK